MTPKKAPLPIVIAGPTASGKSALALALAEGLGGEIVCADSRQVYAGLPIAAACPPLSELARVPHHLYGAVTPPDVVTAGNWAARVDALVAEIAARGRVPILVGGTGLYLRAWRVGLVEPSDPAVRARLEAEAARDLPALAARLAALDPEAAAAVAPTDALRVVRALEIAELKGGPRGAVDLVAQPPRVAAHWLLLDALLDVLEPRIAVRTRGMYAAGMVDEARALAAELPPDHKLLATIGVREALDVIEGTRTLEAAVLHTTLRTRQYARRQRTWFKKEPWWSRLDASSPLPVVVDAVRSLLALSFLGEGR